MHERIGKYHVIREAGAGGFGAVYEGYDLELDRNVAIKICTAAHESQLERFRREARVVSKLRHKNIALVYDFGYDRDAQVHFLVEEFLSGVDLEKKLEDRDRLPPALRVRYLMEIAQGLEFVHERGLIHRDLTPRNIRILHDHTVKIMDFGLAKDATDSTLTHVGDNFGTVGYTAPEQITGMRSVDHRTDIFSLGVMGYELLTLTNPFQAETMGDFLHKIHHLEPPPVSRYWPECPAELAEIIERCIRKSAEDRPSTCEDILPVLKRMIRRLRDHEVPAPYGPRHTVPVPGQADGESWPVPLPSHGPASQPHLERDAAARADTEAAFEESAAPAVLASPAGPDGNATRPADTSLGDAPRTQPLATIAAARPSRRPASVWGVATLVLLTTMALAALFRGSLPWESDGDATRAAELPAASREAAASRAPAATGLSLRARRAGTPAMPSIELEAVVPLDLAAISHCYLERDPAWSHGSKVRLDCGGDVFRHVDPIEVAPAVSYTYRLGLAGQGGEILATARASIPAGG